MSLHRDLYTQLRAAQAQPDVATALLGEVAKLVTGSDSDERGEIDPLLHVIIKSPILCAKALLTWFGESPRDDAADALVRRVNVACFRADAPADVVFPSTNPSAAVLAGCRMNASFVAPEYALGWVLAMLRSWPDDGTAISGSDRLLHYLTGEFFDTLHDLFAKVEPEMFASQPRELLRHYKVQMADERALREGYPYLKEFAMSPQERDVVRALRRQFNKEVMRGAEKKSIFTQFMERRQFKYARTVSFEVAGQPLEQEVVVEMKQHSVEMELPLSEWKDPMDGLRARHDLRKGQAE
jgi:hypothetical protein